MEFDLIYAHFPHMTAIKWILTNVKFNSESIVGVVFPHTRTNILLILSAINLQSCILMNIHFKSLLMPETVRLRRDGRL